MRLLVVEDDKKLAAYIVKGLQEAGFAVDHCPDGDDGLIMATGNQYDAAVIDIMLPGLNRLALAQHLRKQRRAVPVMRLSATASRDEGVKGLHCGTGDY